MKDFVELRFLIESLIDIEWLLKIGKSISQFYEEIENLRKSESNLELLIRILNSTMVIEN